MRRHHIEFVSPQMRSVLTNLKPTVKELQFIEGRKYGGFSHENGNAKQADEVYINVIEENEKEPQNRYVIAFTE